jgi:DNA replication protein DnaC
LESKWLYIKKTDKTCPNCGEPLYSHKLNKEALTCLSCGRKRLEDKNREIELQGGEMALKHGTYDVFYKDSIIDDITLREATFATYEAVDDETNRNKQIALQLADDYLEGKVFNSILQGKQGTGKSHLAISMLKHINENSKPYQKCLFIDFTSVISQVRDFKDESTLNEGQAIKLMSEADYLVIDDIGAEGMTIGNGAKEFVYRILQAVMQARQGKSTILTTNLTSADLNALYGSKLTSRLLRGIKGHAVIFKETSDKRMNYEF